MSDDKKLAEIKAARAMIENIVKRFFDALGWATATSVLLHLAITSHHPLAYALATLSALAFMVWLLALVFFGCFEIWGLHSFPSRSHKFSAALIGAIQLVLLTIAIYCIWFLTPEVLKILATITTTGVASATCH